MGSWVQGLRVWVWVPMPEIFKATGFSDWDRFNKTVLLVCLVFFVLFR